MAAVYGIHVHPLDIAFSGNGVLLVLSPCVGFDRDLSIAGRAMVKTDKGEYIQKLVRINRPSTCIHRPSEMAADAS